MERTPLSLPSRPDPRNRKATANFIRMLRRVKSKLLKDAVGAIEKKEIKFTIGEVLREARKFYKSAKHKTTR